MVGLTSMQYACHYSKVDVVRMLLEEDIDISLRNFQNLNARELTEQCGYDKILEQILEYRKEGFLFMQVI